MIITNEKDHDTLMIEGVRDNNSWDDADKLMVGKNVRKSLTASLDWG